MKHIFIALLLLIPHATLAQDDAEWNSIAHKLKKKAISKVSDLDLLGYCNLFIEFKHTKRHAIIVNVTSSGDYQICKLSKRAVKKGQRFKYKQPEKYLRIHIANE